METNIFATSTSFKNLTNGSVFVADSYNNRYLGIKFGYATQNGNCRYVLKLAKNQHDNFSFLQVRDFGIHADYTVLALTNVKLDLCLHNAIFQYPANGQCGRILLISDVPYLYADNEWLLNLNTYEIFEGPIINAVAFDKWRLIQDVDSKEIEIFSYSSR